MPIIVFLLICWTIFWDFCLVNCWAKNCFRVWNLNYAFSHINICVCLVEGRIVSVLVSHLPRLNCLPLVLSVSLMHSLLSFRQNAKKLNQQANTALLHMQLYQCWSCLAASQECSASLYCSGLGGAKMYSRWIQFLGCLFPQKLSMWIQTVICQWK